MKRLWKCSLGLSLGFLVGPAVADEIQWRPAGSRPAAPQPTEQIAIVQPAPAPTTGPIATTGTCSPAVYLDKPVANGTASGVHPIAFAGPRPVARGQTPDGPRAMPVGPPSTEQSTSKKIPAPPEGPPIKVEDASSQTPVLPPPTPVPDGTPTPETVVTPDQAPVPGEVVNPVPAGDGGPVMDGQVFDGQVIDGDVMDGDVIDGDVIDGDMCSVEADGCCPCDEGVFGGLRRFGHWGKFRDGPFLGGRPLFGMFHRDGAVVSDSPGFGPFLGLGLFQQAWFGREATVLGTGERVYFRIEALVWGTKGQDLPPLVTANPKSRPNSGALGQPATRVLFGGDTDFDPASGLRFVIGYWFTDAQGLGIEWNHFKLGTQDQSFSAGSQHLVTIARPFFNLDGDPRAQRIAFPGTAGRAGANGVVDVSLSSQLSGNEINFIRKITQGPGGGLTGLLGFRAMTLDEDLRIASRTDMLATEQIIMQGDLFSTQNKFYGGQLGLRPEFRCGRFTVDLTGKVALGVTDESVTIAGARILRSPGDPTIRNGRGLLAQPTNIGTFSQSKFAVIPEAGVTIGYQITDWWKVYAGYNFLYWSAVARPGSQIDLVVNRNQPPVPANVAARRPMFMFQNTDYWAQGLTAGMEFRY